MYYIRFAKSLISCHDSAVSFLLISTFLTIGFVFLFIPCGFIFHWILRIFVWFVMGPWMRLGEIAATRHGSARQIQRVVDEIKEREQQRLLEARINKEEAMKLKATRCMRFGRFAVRVPFANIIRYHDQPLPESYAEQASGADSATQSKLHITHYIPGQKHHGVMIPDLYKNTHDSGAQKKVAGTDLKRGDVNFSHNNAKIPNDLSLCINTSMNLHRMEPFNFGNELIVKSVESSSTSDEGFELVPKSNTMKSTIFDRKIHYLSNLPSRSNDNEYYEQRDEQGAKKRH